MRSTAVSTVAVLCLAVSLPVAAGDREAAAPGGPLLRFPDVAGDTVVFTYGEDIWSVPAGGGTARRLTDDEGQERHPKLSPDGSLIAFTGDVDGNPDVYVMRADGSGLRRLTYHPEADEVVGWHPTAGTILFRSSRSSWSRFDRLFLISPEGGGVEELPLPEAGRGCFSPDGARIAYNQIATEDRTWKRYHGGMAQDIRVYDFATAEDRRITDHSGADRLPMWIGDAIYFASDRTGTMNIYRYDTAGGGITQVTHHTDFDVLRPSEGGDRVVYEHGGALWLLDTSTGSTAPILVEIPTEPREARPYLKNVREFITDAAISPAGGRAVVAARGEVFTVPREHGEIRNITRTPGARERNPAWSPDGERIAFLSDRSGEYQIWVVDAAGTSEPRQLTSRQRGYPHTLRWSPDSTRIAFTDETLALLWVDVATGRVTVVDRAEVEPMDVGPEAKPISDFAWSPDSRYIAYSKIGRDQVSNIWVAAVDTGTTSNLSSGLYNDFGPVFTRDGEHLLFVSNRRFDPTFCDFEWEMVYKDVAGIYALTLRRDGPPLLPLRSDEAAATDDAQRSRSAGEADPVTVQIDLDGITDRIEALPLPRGNYRQLAAGADTLYALDGEDGDFNRFEFRELPPRELVAFSFEERSDTVLVDGVIDYALAADGLHLVYRTEDGIAIWDTEPGHEPARRTGRPGEGLEDDRSFVLDLAGLETTIDPIAEWTQVFWEAWRIERDFFYDPNLHGLDWPALGAKYARFLPGLSCAQDLHFIVGELISELSTSHTYVRVGDRRRRAPAVEVGLLGADWTVDRGRYRLAKIYRVPHWSREVDPPLAGPGIDVREGDYLIAVDGRDVAAADSIYAHFQGLADHQVRLTFSADPSGTTPREAVVVPISSERTLRYLDWVEHNRRVVDEASGGRIGYLHLPDTYLGSAIEFPAYYYAQTRKQGMLIDGRFNGGGLDPDIFLARLAKAPLSYWTRRYSEDQVTPVFVSGAHLALLTNRQAGSGGDELPHEFQQKGMGPVIGTRTWGGLVGISMSFELMDGSEVTAPDYRIYTPGGEWTVENEGVTPDITVELDPAEMARGWDAQLQKGIEVLLSAIEREPIVRPQHPPFPVLR
ncbi:MAG TPA: PDZ domain-containing protein [Thermoanaerobaculales bacterium]|nr:PDZ domain-containing protein [Thermoanaerobaculales bacterium]HQL28980.1 PDZ domain-containing protein [Thermoanaerobaculales bacterium]